MATRELAMADLFGKRHLRPRGASVSGGSDLIDIAGAARSETDKAILFDDGTQTVWLPKSQVEDNEDGTYAMPEWLAKEKGLI